MAAPPAMAEPLAEAEATAMAQGVYRQRDRLLQSGVFNFIEYLTSTLCTNLQPGYLALDYSLHLSTSVRPLVLRL